MSKLALALLLALVPQLSFASQTIVIEPGPVEGGEDTAVYEFFPNLIRGDYPTLWAFQISQDNQSHTFRTFMRFDLPEPIEGACVEEAVIFLVYSFDASGYGEGENVPGTVSCKQVLGSWREADTTWSNQPPTGPTLDTIANITTFQTLVFDVTPLAQSWADGAANHGVAFTSSTTRGMGFWSFEANPEDVDPLLKPALSITLADDPLACPEPAAAATAALIVLIVLAVGRRRS